MSAGDGRGHRYLYKVYLFKAPNIANETNSHATGLAILDRHLLLPPATLKLRTMLSRFELPPVYQFVRTSTRRSARSPAASERVFLMRGH